MAQQDFVVEYQLETTRKVAGGVSHLQRSIEEQNLVLDEVTCSVTESSPRKDATNLRRRDVSEAAIERGRSNLVVPTTT